MINKSTIKKDFVQLFRLWVCFLIFVFLPADLLFRIDSFLLSMFWWDLVANTAFITLVFIVLAAFITLAVLPLLFGLNFITNNSSRLTCLSLLNLTNYLLLFLSSYTFAKLFKNWIYKFNFEIPLKALYIGILLAVFIFLKNRTDFHNKIYMLVINLCRPLPAIALLFLVVIGARALIYELKDRKESQQIKQAWGKAAPLIKGKPNIIMVTFDTLAADDMSTYGYHLKTTPNIDAFASKSTVYESFYANSNCTLSSIASLFTGVSPNNHLLNNINNYYYDPGTLNNNYIKYLKLNGYMTHAVASGLLTPHPAATGLERYFDSVNKIDLNGLAISEIALAECSQIFHFASKRWHLVVGRWIGMIFAEQANYLYHLPFIKPPGTGIPYSPELLAEQAIDIIKKHGPQPYFLWIHFLQPHNPYVTRKDLLGSFTKNDSRQKPTDSDKYQSKKYSNSEQLIIDKFRLQYDESILYVDAVFGDFVEELKKIDGFENNILVVSSDHGESFKNNYFGHNYECLNQSVIKVPLIIGNIPLKTARSFAPGSQVDVFPTILQLVDIPKPEWAQGESLLQNTEKNSNKYVFSMNLDGNQAGGQVSKGHIAVIFDNYKLVYNINTKLSKLYDLRVDKHEKNDISLMNPITVDLLSKAAIKKLQEKPYLLSDFAK